MKRFLCLLAMSLVLMSGYAYALTPTAGHQDSQPITDAINEGVKYPERIVLDSLYSAPVLISWFDSPVTIELANSNKLIIDVAEITDLYTGEKDYKLHFNVDFTPINTLTSMKIKRFLTYEKSVSIINALKAIYNYTQSAMPNIKENINYCIYLESGIEFNVALSYDPKDYKWDCVLEFVAENSVMTNSENYRVLPTNGFVLYGKLKNISLDLPKMIDVLEQRLITLKNRMRQDTDTISSRFSAYQGDGFVYFWIVDKRGDKEYRDVEIDTFSKIFKKGHIKDLNKKVNKVLLKEIVNFESLGEFGFVEIVVDVNGNIVESKLAIKDAAKMHFSNRVMTLLFEVLNDFSELKFNYANKEVEEVHWETLKIRIPLTSAN